MRRDKIIYWVATSVVTFMALMAGFMYFTNPTVADGFRHLGFPDYFRVELGVAKLVGGLVIILPMVPARIKEWAYAGFTIVFISAMIAHGVVEGPSKIMGPVISMVFLIVSYIYFGKLRNHKEAQS